MSFMLRRNRLAKKYITGKYITYYFIKYNAKNFKAYLKINDHISDNSMQMNMNI